MVKKQAKKELSFTQSIEQGLKYPWNKASRLWYILWILVPIFGWFALIGYMKTIVKELVTKQRKELPEFGPFWDNFTQGVKVIIFIIPTYIVLSLIGAVPIIGTALYYIVSIFIIPWLMINFFVKDSFSALWELQKAFDIVFNNAVEYIIAAIKTLIYEVVYGLLSIVLIGIPCYAFGNLYFLTDFYKKYN
jgi:hypothetical protein